MVLSFPNLRSFNLLSSKLAVKGLDPTSITTRLDTMNRSLGFTDEAGKVDATGFRQVGDDIVFGNSATPYTSFLSLSAADQTAFLNSSINFPDPNIRAKIASSLDSNFASSTAIDLARAANAKSIVTAKQYFVDSAGNIRTTDPRFGELMGKFGTVVSFGAKVGITYFVLNKLAESNSGCFIIGPQGQKIGVSGDCNCLGGAANPNAQACCTKCRATGETDLLCPEDLPASSSGTRTYVCPATTVQQNAPALPLFRASQTCASCGCKTEWQLCNISTDPLDLLWDMASDVGNVITDLGNGVMEIGKQLVGVLSEPIKIVLITVGIAIAVAGIIAAVVFVLKKKNKLK